MPQVKQSGASAEWPVTISKSSVDEPAETEKAAPVTAGSSTELLEIVTGHAADAPLCFTCGTKMRRAGSCYVCEGCGSTSGCS